MKNFSWTTYLTFVVVIFTAVVIAFPLIRSAIITEGDINAVLESATTCLYPATEVFEDHKICVEARYKDIKGSKTGAIKVDIIVGELPKKNCLSRSGYFGDNPVVTIRFSDSSGFELYKAEFLQTDFLPISGTYNKQATVYIHNVDKKVAKDIDNINNTTFNTHLWNGYVFWF